ncbi:hypothetical protein QOZ80_7AG0560030 [Eleusine coracana subsp. coracana]|nr:hypothetical protein QOZ80_7AG0560030 [Eleusine coracana subsp. coracana]
MLPRLAIGVQSLIRPATPDSTTVTVRCVHEATAKFADALRFFLAAADAGQRRNIINTLEVRFPLTKQRSLLHEIGRLVSGAAEVIRRLEVTLDTVSELDHVLRDCEALEALHLSYCWFTPLSALTIDGSRRFRELRVVECYVDGVHLVRAPGLVDLWCEMWFCQASPLTFAPDSAPSLKRLTLINRGTRPGQLSFKLSDLLHNANPVEHLKLDFNTGKVWVQPEMSRGNLGDAFSKLKRLYIRRVPAQIDMTWTMFLLEAAPLLELVDVHVSDDHHPCCCPNNNAAAGDSVQDLQWHVSDGFEHRHLQAFKIRGGVDPDGDLSFLRLVMERAVNLKLLLVNARVTCESCIVAKQKDPSFVASKFPGDKDGVDAFVRDLKDGVTTTSSARIVIFSPSAHIFEY